MGDYQFIYTDGSISRHDTLDGLVEMLITEIEEEDYEREYASYKNGWSKKQKIDFLQKMDVQVICQ